MAEADAAIIAELRLQGAIVIGKTSTDQICDWLAGGSAPLTVSLNASFSNDHVSGRSPCGSAVVAGKGIVSYPLLLGTDTARFSEKYQQHYSTT